MYSEEYQKIDSELMRDKIKLDYLIHEKVDVEESKVKFFNELKEKNKEIVKLQEEKEKTNKIHKDLLEKRKYFVDKIKQKEESIKNAELELDEEIQELQGQIKDIKQHLNYSKQISKLGDNNEISEGSVNLLKMKSGNKKNSK